VGKRPYGDYKCLFPCGNSRPISRVICRKRAPDQPPFVEVGALVEAGTPLGLIEVMKTFSHVVYQPTAGLPARARITRVLAEDGADLEVGTPLLEVEPA
jgi:acetyl-CoA carboxylase biotin carboxyl carrier protein